MTQIPYPTLDRADLARTLRDGDPDARLYLLPEGLSTGVEANAGIAAGRALRLAGTWGAFGRVRLVMRQPGSIQVGEIGIDALDALLRSLPSAAWERANVTLARLVQPRRSWAGLDLSAPLLMGIINVTPDSFSDGGAALEPTDALAAAARLRREGADILDIGAESTRPGADAVPEATELQRLNPLLQHLGGDRHGTVFSIDTRKATIMRAAVASGFAIVNDVSALTDDALALPTVAETGAHTVLMHRQGESRTMNLAPSYDNVLLDVYDDLEARVAACEAAGIPRGHIAIDPGIGFGKRGPENRALLRGLALFHGLGCPILIGLSRKSFSRSMEDRYRPADRLPGTLAALTFALARGSQILRVHDVAAVKQAVEAWMTIAGDRE